MMSNRVRDERSNAILNTDVQSLNKYKAERAFRRKVENLSKEVSDLKEMLEKICEKLDQIEKS